MLFKKKKKQVDKSGVQKFGGELDFPTAEAYNLLRTNLSFAFPGKTDGKIIGVTSASPSEGKSFTAINLSYSLAKNGHKVLILDADMRKPTIAEKLHLSFAPGLSNLLADSNADYVHHTIALHDNISVLTSGDIPPNPSELIGSAEMQRNLEEFAKSYDYIIVDLPPVMEVTDALVMSKYLDGIVMVVMHEQSHRSEIKETVRKLQFANARILGFVYNGFSTASKRYYYKKRYYRYYRKKETQKKKEK